MSRACEIAVALLLTNITVSPAHGEDAITVMSARLPSPRGTTAIWDGTHAYLFGGNDGTIKDEILRYHPTSDTLLRMNAPLPTPRYGASAIWDGTHAYIFGGARQPSAGRLNEILRYDSATDSLTPMTARLPTPRYGMSAIWDGTHAYLFGGNEDGYAQTDQILRYTPATDSLTAMTSRLPSPRDSTSAIWDGQRAYIFGGWNGTRLNDILRFDPGTGIVSRMSSALPSGRSNTSAVWSGRQAYILGGYSEGFLGDILRFDPAADSINDTNVRLPTARSGMTEIWDGRHAFLFGGSDGALLNEIVRYDPIDPFGCPEPTRTVTRGAWMLACLEPVGSLYRASGPIKLNGMDVQVLGGGVIEFSPSEGTLTASGTVEVTAGPVTVSGVTVGPITVFRGALSWDLDLSSVSFGFPSGGMLGLPVGLTATATATSPGVVAVELDSPLPSVFGGGTARAGFRVSAAAGLQVDSIKVGPISASMGFARLNDLLFAYDSSGTWSVSATVEGVVGAALEGSFTYAGGALQAAAFSITDLVVGELFELSRLEFSYESEGAGVQKWSGAVVGAGENPASGSALLRITDGTLSEVRVALSRLKVFEVDVESFLFSYGAGVWDLSGRARVGGGTAFDIDAGLTFSGSRLTGGHFKLANLSLGGKLQVKDLQIAFAGSRWSGSGRVVLPGPMGREFAGSFEVDDGALKSASVSASGLNVPIGAAIWLNRVALSLDTSPWMLGGGMGVSAGPAILGRRAVIIDGDATYAFPPPGFGAFDIRGTVSLVEDKFQLTTGRVGFDADGVTFGGHLDVSWGGTGVVADVSGGVGEWEFLAEGAGSVKVLGKTLTGGQTLLSTKGIAVCGNVGPSGWGWKAGFGYRWGSLLPGAFTGCDLGSYRPAGLSAADASSQTSASIAIAPNLPVAAIEIAAGAATPDAILHAPDGVAFTTDEGVFEHHAVIKDPEQHKTYVLIDTPAEGLWQIEQSAASVPITSIAHADGLPAPLVGATISGDGNTRTLTWTVEPIDGQQVSFMEGEVLINTTSEASGSVTFSPADGPAGARNITAHVLQDDLPRATLTVATYDAPALATLTIQTEGLGSGTVDSSPAGIACPPACALQVPAGTTITLTATAAPDSAFGHWTGVCAEPQETCTLTIDQPVGAGAHFLDITPPETTITAGPPTATRDTTATISFTADEAASTFECALDSGSFVPCASPQVYSSLPQGPHTARVRATDPSGNTDPTPAAITWIVDRTNPTINFVAPRPGHINILDNQIRIPAVNEPRAIIIGPNTVRASASDTHSGIANVAFTVDGIPIDPSQITHNSQTGYWEFRFQGHLPGEHQLATTATDLAGNTKTATMPLLVLA